MTTTVEWVLVGLGCGAIYAVALVLAARSVGGWSALRAHVNDDPPAGPSPMYFHAAIGGSVTWALLINPLDTGTGNPILDLLVPIGVGATWMWRVRGASDRARRRRGEGPAVRRRG